VGIEVVPDAGATDLDLEVGLDLTDAALAPLRRDVAGAALDAERLRAAAAAVRLELGVREAFYGLQAAEQQRRVAQRALDGFAAGRDVARALLRSGGAPAVDVIAQEAAYERARLAVVEAEQATVAARERLRGRIGVVDLPPDVSPALPPVPASPPEAADLEARAVAASLELAELRARVEVLDRAATLAGVQGWLPEVDVSLLASSPRASGRLAEAPPWSLGAGVELTVPLFAQGVAARRALDHRADAGADRLDAAAVTLRADARALATRLVAAHARALHLRDVVLPAQRETLRQTLLQFDAMQVGAFALLQAQRATFEVELALVEATRAYWAADAGADALCAGVRPDPDASLGAPSLGGAPAPGGH
jgi:outer membrane protein TolC